MKKTPDMRKQYEDLAPCDNNIGDYYWVLYGEDKDLIVTHWMPLPTPPSGDKSSPVEKGGEE